MTTNVDLSWRLLLLPVLAVFDVVAVIVVVFCFVAMLLFCCNVVGGFGVSVGTVLDCVNAVGFYLGYVSIYSFCLSYWSVIIFVIV